MLMLCRDYTVVAENDEVSGIASLSFETQVDIALV